MYRRQIRTNVFILVFENTFKNDLAEEVICCSKEVGEIEINDEVEVFFLDIENNIESIDLKISSYLKNWTIDRISKVSLSILRVAFYEMTYLENMQDAIAINEAVEIAKIYTSKEDVSFINGVLGGYSKSKNLGDDVEVKSLDDIVESESYADKID